MEQQGDAFMSYRNILVMLMIVFLMIGVCGCTMNNINNQNVNQSDVLLNERQKEILIARGLPTEYAELTFTQKKVIITIEEMLVHAENKYGITVKYISYTAKSWSDAEHVTMCTIDDNNHTFSVTKTQDGYIDDYIAVAVVKDYENYVCNAIKQFLPTAEIKVFATITKTTLTAIPKLENAFDGATEAAIWIFVDGIACSDAEFQNFINMSKGFLSDHSLYSSVQFIRLKDCLVDQVERSTFEDFLSDKFYYARELVYINK